MLNQINENLSKGVILFSGYGAENHLGEYSERVSAEFRKSDPKALDKVQVIFAELDELKPDWTLYSLQKAGIWAIQVLVSS